MESLLCCIDVDCKFFFLTGIPGPPGIDGLPGNFSLFSNVFITHC